MLQPLAGTAGDDRADGDATTQHEEPAAIDRRLAFGRSQTLVEPFGEARALLVADLEHGLRRVQPVEEHEQRHDPGERADEGRQDVERVADWPLHRDDRAHDPERADPDDTDPRAAVGQRADDQPEHPDHDQHTDAQRGLVVRPELVDGEVLQPDRRAIDELGADRVAR